MVTPAKKSTSQVQEEIVRLLVATLLAAGFLLTVNNGGEEDEITDSADADAVLAQMRATADEELYARKPGTAKRQWVSLIYGYRNAGWKVISDYSLGLEEILQPVNELAERFADNEEG